MLLFFCRGVRWRHPSLVTTITDIFILTYSLLYHVNLFEKKNFFCLLSKIRTLPLVIEPETIVVFDLRLVLRRKRIYTHTDRSRWYRNQFQETSLSQLSYICLHILLQIILFVVCTNVSGSSACWTTRL